MLRCEEQLASDWTVDEPLAIAIAASTSSPLVHEALPLAVNHSGDSDSTGSIACNIFGARYGIESLPTTLASSVEGGENIDGLAFQVWNMFHNSNNN